MLPLIEPLPREGLSNLFRTGGAHTALRLMELDALGLELEPAEIKHAPHVTLQIIDDILMMYAKNPSRQHTVPMPHQLQIGSVVARDILDAVRELLALRKKLLQITETARHRSRRASMIFAFGSIK